MPESFSGVVLAGGRSRRMGCDKAFLAVDGITLVHRQAALLRSVGCDEVIISGRPGVDYDIPESRVVLDPMENAGPLAGLVAALNATRHERVLVLAVDLPHMTAAFLRRLLAASDMRHGTVPYGSHGYEPLVACYPRTLLDVAQDALTQGAYSLQTLLSAAEAKGMVRRLPLEPGDEGLLTNWNTPEDTKQ